MSGCSSPLVAHDCCEVVLVTLCSFSPALLNAPEDRPSCPGHVRPLAEHRFSFVQDLAFDMAQFLVRKPAFVGLCFQSVAVYSFIFFMTSKQNLLLNFLGCKGHTIAL